MLDSKHPEYTLTYEDWCKMRHTYAGERAVKEAGLIYLPATSGQFLDGLGPQDKGWQSYCAYRARATFPNYVTEAVKAMVGVMHNLPAQIDLPAALEPLRDKATVTGESLLMLLRRINEAQLITGRIGLLLDLPATPLEKVIPYIATYDAERIINWDNGRREEPVLQTLNLVVLDESENERQADFQWVMKNKYRVLVLGDTAKDEAQGAAIYRQGLFSETVEFSEAGLMTPQLRGKELNEIPFVFINSTDLLAETINPPLLELANLCLTIYRGEADYRQTLFMQGQDTLVVIGGDDDDDIRIGAGAHITVPISGDAKFIGVGAAGLSEQREALENDHKRAQALGGQLLDTTSREKESGAALKVRVAAQTTTLNQVAMAGAEGLQTILRQAAVWIGADPAAVKVTPNLEFAEDSLTPAECLALAQAKAQGMPLSEESFHALLKAKDYTKLDFKDEMLLIEEERARMTNVLV